MTVQDQCHTKLLLLDGSQMLANPSGLTRDLIHPGDYGHAEMGYAIAAALKPHTL